MNVFSFLLTISYLIILMKNAGNSKTRPIGKTSQVKRLNRKAAQKKFPGQMKNFYLKNQSWGVISKNKGNISDIDLENSSLANDILINTFLNTLKDNYFDIYRGESDWRSIEFILNRYTYSWVGKHFPNPDITTVLRLHELKNSMKNVFNDPTKLEDRNNVILEILESEKHLNRPRTIELDDYRSVKNKIFDLFFNEKIKAYDTRSEKENEPNLNFFPLLFLSTKMKNILYRIFSSKKACFESISDENKTIDISEPSKSISDSDDTDLDLFLPLGSSFDNFKRIRINKSNPKTNEIPYPLAKANYETTYEENNIIDIREELKNIFDEYKSLCIMVSKEFIRKSSENNDDYKIINAKDYLDIIDESDNIKNIIESLKKIEKFFAQKKQTKILAETDRQK